MKIYDKRKYAWKLVIIRYDERISWGAIDDSYVLEYPKNTIVQAQKHTLGVFLFSSRKEARDYKKLVQERCVWQKLQILKVELLDIAIIPDVISKYSLTEFYSNKPISASDDKTSDIPKGTICCRKIKVLT